MKEKKITKKCQYCGKTFKAKSNKAKYCSNSCKLRTYRLRKLKKKGGNVETETDEDLLREIDRLREINESIEKEKEQLKNEFTKVYNKYFNTLKDYVKDRQELIKARDEELKRFKDGL